MLIAGIDLSGPVNCHDTVMVAFEGREGALACTRVIEGADDLTILRALEGGPWVVGIDAPLSYPQGGGDRPADRALREHLKALGIRGPRVISPLQTRMAYLTLRGIALTRLLTLFLRPSPAMVETHPGAAMALRGAFSKTYKKTASSDGREGVLFGEAVPNPSQGETGPFSVKSERLMGISGADLLAWMEGEGLSGIFQPAPSPHYVDACAAALGAWDWFRKRSRFLFPADPPLHPYDLAC